MAINYNVEGLKSCPVCYKRDKLYIGYSEKSDYKHVACTRCEIDTWSRVETEKWWNELPRHNEVISDSHYPDMSGWYLVKEICKAKPHKRYFNIGIGSQGKFVNIPDGGESIDMRNICIPHKDIEWWKEVE